MSHYLLDYSLREAIGSIIPAKIGKIKEKKLLVYYFKMKTNHYAHLAPAHSQIFLKILWKNTGKGLESHFCETKL